MKTRTASIKETGDELRQADWPRFDAAIAEDKAKRPEPKPCLEHGIDSTRQETNDAEDET